MQYEQLFNEFPREFPLECMQYEQLFNEFPREFPLEMGRVEFPTVVNLSLETELHVMSAILSLFLFS